MREIKFRAWDKIQKKIYYGAFSVGADGYGVIDAGWRSIDKGFGIDCILMQYTGLKDKNGRKIHEGDIVTFNGKLVVIEWNEAEGLFWGGNNNQRFILQWADMLIVVGNIYENPELLK